MSIRPKTLGAVIVFLTGALLFASPSVYAEDESEGLEARLRKQMEKILELMRQNEEALLKLSTGTKAEPKAVKIDPPTPSPSGSPSSSGGSGGSEIRRKLDELMKSRRRGSRQIPGELEKLVRMIPRRPGQGQGPPQPGQQPQGEGQKPETRDAQRRERKRTGQDEPAGGERSPRDPNDRMESERKREAEAQEPQPKGEAPWKVWLPAEVRDAAESGPLDKIPEKYRETVRRYLMWLAKQKAPE